MSLASILILFFMSARSCSFLRNILSPSDRMSISVCTTCVIVSNIMSLKMLWSPVAKCSKWEWTGLSFFFLSFIGPPFFQFAAIMIPEASFEVHNKAKSMIVWHCWQIGGYLDFSGSVFSCMVKLDCCVGTCLYFLFCGKGDCIHSFLRETVPWNSNSLN